MPSPSEKHVAGEWPEVILCRATAAADPKNYGVFHVEHFPPGLSEARAYVPKSRLEEERRCLVEARNRTILLRAGMDRLEEEAQQEEDRADRLQATLDALSKPEVVEAADSAINVLAKLRAALKPNGAEEDTSEVNCTCIQTIQGCRVHDPTAFKHSGAEEECSTCRGTGEIEMQPSTNPRSCPDCNGTGRVVGGEAEAGENAKCPVAEAHAIGMYIGEIVGRLAEKRKLGQRTWGLFRRKEGEPSGWQVGLWTGDPDEVESAQVIELLTQQSNTTVLRPQEVEEDDKERGEAMWPASRAHLALVAAILRCLETGVYPETIREFVNEELEEFARQRREPCDGEGNWHEDGAVLTCPGCSACKPETAQQPHSEPVEEEGAREDVAAKLKALASAWAQDAEFQQRKIGHPLAAAALRKQADTALQAAHLLTQQPGAPSNSGGVGEQGAAEMLAEFHRVFAHPDTDALWLRPTLHREEHAELIEALEEGDRPGIARELADVVYIAYGTALVYGIDLDAALREVHRANLSKVGVDGKPIRRDDGKVLKGGNFQPPDMSASCTQQPDPVPSSDEAGKEQQ